MPFYIKVKLMLSSYEKGRDLDILNLNNITFNLTYQDIVERKTLQKKSFNYSFVQLILITFFMIYIFKMALICL